MNGSSFSLEINPVVPPMIGRLPELANNLYYGWNSPVRYLFSRIDPECWLECEDSPQLFLRRVAQSKLDAAAADPVYLDDYDDVCRSFDNYMSRPPAHDAAGLLRTDDLIAYFCAEYGFHESLPIYSGGLGILAGDHCKAASDLGLPFVAIGLLYRQGYFRQAIDAQGNQIASYRDLDFETLPIELARDDDGNPLSVTLDFPGRQVTACIWQASVGRITLYLLDTDVAENSEADRTITYRLYGGDRRTRIEQEIVLGIGGIKALRVLGLQPTVWHINEGHSAFQIVERLRERVEGGLSVDVAREVVAARTIFTTHTPVPAGHDVFDDNLVDEYFSALWPALGLNRDQFIGLGHQANQPGFNMTALALRCSRQHNGVSAIHGRVASEMEQGMWPDIAPRENPIRHVTNGIHVNTFLARDLAQLFDNRHRDWHYHLRDKDYWQFIEEIPDERFWSLRASIKAEMLTDIKRRLIHQLEDDGMGTVRVKRTLSYLEKPESDLLVIGFARRFATYKRANLLFRDRDRLARLLADEDRPVVFIFAGKAHPADEPGQALIREIWQLSNDPRFHGRVLLIEGYDMALARKLVTGCDVWLNNPEYPLEASGTSGQKAGINGVLNLSVLDGWWGEGFQDDNGWAITPYDRSFDRQYRDDEEARDLMTLLESEVKPMFFDRDNTGYPREWIRRSKRAVSTILPQFNSERMVCDYLTHHYIPAIEKGRRLIENDFGVAKSLADFRDHIHTHWTGISAKLVERPPARIESNDTITLTVEVQLDGLNPEEVGVECLFGKPDRQGEWQTHIRYLAEPDEVDDQGAARYTLKTPMTLDGLQHYRVRVVPLHPGQTHPYEMGLMKWL